MDPSALIAFGMPGMVEWIIILVVALLLFGRRLPEVMRGLGGGVREFRKGIEGATEEANPIASAKKDDQADEPKQVAGSSEGVSTTEDGKAPSEPRS